MPAKQLLERHNRKWRLTVATANYLTNGSTERMVLLLSRVTIIEGNSTLQDATIGVNLAMQ